MIILIKRSIVSFFYLISLTTPTLAKDMEDMEDAAINVLNNEMPDGGESVARFEAESAKYTGSGSSALLLTFRALGIRPWDKVLTPSATFIATSNGSSMLGGLPVV